MYIKIPTVGISRMEWLKLRKKGIGGSDAAAVCGLNPYSSPMKVFIDKTNEDVVEEDNDEYTGALKAPVRSNGNH